ncbi:cytochrome P450 2F2-like protein [Labeo rohita]|uniref:Cytochrome P450 2F2-like protein n=1 Tax=Labeo rohita TaxID=84645 RepID=A0A498N5Y3_LABRO|nr:cytochrome P450 2F2-like protein [Labeo rohita]
MLGFLILVWTCIFLLFFFIQIPRPKNFPPGPRPLPLFGNLLELNINNPLKDFERLADRYGKVYSLYIGSRPWVFLNGFEVLKEALVTKAVDFAGRPQDLMVNHITKGSGSSFDPQTMFHNAASNIICIVLFGSRYDYDDEFLKLFIHLFTENSKIANGPWAMIYDTFPLVRSLPLPFKKAFINAHKAREMCEELVNEHKKTRVPREPRDFIDCYLDELDKRGNDGSSFSEAQLILYVLDLHFAGTDTTSNTLLTAFLYLMTYPEVQARCQKEIDEVLEGKDHASYEDRHYMPYTMAVIHEVQRVANTVPLSVFHCTTKDTTLMGYNIPKGTFVIPNLTSVLKDEGQWKFPHEFNPANFLNDQGQFVKPEAFMPFSTGTRICLGEGLARMELFLVIVTLLRRYQFVWPDDAGEPDYTPVYGVTLTPKPYRMHIRRRETVRLG